MTDIKLTPKHDLLIVDGDIVLHTTKEERTLQELKINLQNHKGNWFVDKTSGVPYLDEVLSTKSGKEVSDVLLKEVIKTTDNIASITSYTSTYNGRKLDIQFSATLISGGFITTTLEI